MNKSSLTNPEMPPITAPTGFWKVLCVIAERIPPHQLIWLALMLCLFALGLGYIGYATLSRTAESKPATALTGYIKQHMTTESDNAP